MAWSWRFEDVAGEQVTVEDPVSELFPSRGDAESWLGENWRALSDAGVAQVTLLDGEDARYTMKLDDA
ncbi:hypothetical protein J4H86_05605 [Spiractinospora alimapuensis]|nr:hypothetical protein [Spiractinospora alimapuensis]QVQ54701.1 hypothetical protein J4H86_05605 [Spiractinospora alimapuensis]